MFPVALNLQTLPILLIGKGEAYARRKAQLLESGAKFFTCHSYESGDPGQINLNDSVVIMVAGLDYNTSETIASYARMAGKLVNVEDVPELCDFYFMAQVKRGDLLIAISTNGASPTVAKRIRDYIARRFGAEWAGFVDEMKQHRLQLRAEGKGMKDIMHASDALLQDKGWLDCAACKHKDTV